MFTFVAGGFFVTLLVEAVVVEVVFVVGVFVVPVFVAVLAGPFVRVDGDFVAVVFPGVAVPFVAGVPVFTEDCG